MPTSELAASLADTMRALTRGDITPDQMRTAYRTARAEHGDAAFEAAKARAVMMHVARPR